jgi:asparagine synthase (glutamine-hydrolysing)
MCGIVGALSFRNSAFTITERLLTAMRDTMEHRGPDGAGNWISEGAAQPNVQLSKFQR